jgi:RNA polymerase sigma factor (sigma-70 family)
MTRAAAARPMGERARALASDPAHIALAVRIARRMAAPCPRLAEEFESAALLGLAEAAAAFDPGAGASFATYAAIRIAGAIRDAARRERPSGYRRAEEIRPGEAAPRVRPLHAPAGPGGEDAPADLLASAELPVGWEAESQDGVRRLIRDLPGRHKAVMQAFYLDASCGGITARVGEKFGVGENAIWLTRKQAVAMIRESHPTPGDGGP